MNTDVYIREAEGGFTRRLGAEVIEEWETGRMIRSESRLESEPFISYYIVDGESLSAVKLGPAKGEGPFDYAAEIDPSDTRPLPDFEIQAT